MITHLITKYKRPVVTVAPTLWPYTPAAVSYPSQVPLQLGKHTYAQYIKNIPYQKGMFLIFKDTSYPYALKDTWKVTDIQEIWYLCEGRETAKPRPLQVVNVDGKTQWINPLDVFRINVPGLTF
jgi:hypothetical protein